jgi:hypothetical protein
MLAGALPVVMSRKRADGVPLARAQGATVILMDDGFQSPAVVKDASLIVIDSERGLGNGQVFPAGPLRAPLRPQLARTDALIVVGTGTAAEAVAEEIAAQGKPVLSAHLKPDEAVVAELRGKRVLAFAGIGSGASELGKMWRNMIRLLFAPSARAAVTNSLCRSLMNSARANRAIEVQPVQPATWVRPMALATSTPRWMEAIQAEQENG